MSHVKNQGRRDYARLHEPLAWRFLTVLYRRHHRSALGLLEEHPCGGTYNVRSLVSPDREVSVAINLGLSLTLFGAREFRVEGQDLWPRLAAEGFDGLLDEVSEALGWPQDDGEPTAVWTYRFIASFLQAAAWHRPRWTCEAEVTDFGGFRGIVDHFPGARRALDAWTGPLLHGSGACFFWALVRDEEPKLLVDTKGRLWSNREQIALLPELARACGGRTWEMTMRAAGAWLE